MNMATLSMAEPLSHNTRTLIIAQSSRCKLNPPRMDAIAVDRSATNSANGYAYFRLNQTSPFLPACVDESGTTSKIGLTAPDLALAVCG